jgi:hypothetical protein
LNSSCLRRSLLVRLPMVLGPPCRPSSFPRRWSGRQRHAATLGVARPNHDIVIVCPQGLIDPTVNETHWYTPWPGDPAVPTTDLAIVNALLELACCHRPGRHAARVRGGLLQRPVHDLVTHCAERVRQSLTRLRSSFARPESRAACPQRRERAQYMQAGCLRQAIAGW